MASLVINGGTFECITPKWTLNSHDSKKGNIIVTSGSFKGYNPAQSNSENPVANFVAEDKCAKETEGKLIYTKCSEK